MIRKRVVVVGSGAAGMAAAVAAATNGAKVTLLEAASGLGGTTATSGGGIWVPANPWAAAHGVRDSVEDGIRYLRALQQGRGKSSPLSEAYPRESLRVVPLIEQRTPLRWQHLVGRPDYHSELEGGNRDGRSLEIEPVQVGPDALAQVRPNPYAADFTITEAEAAVPPDDAERARRRREGIGVGGRGLIAALYLTLRESGGHVVTGARATRLVRARGGVVGVEADGTRFRGQVVLASGGFERNSTLVESFLEGPMVAPGGPPSNRGDGLLMGMEAGAALDNMSAAWWVAAAQVPGETIDGAPFYRMLFREPGRPGAVVVDGSGRRFANEAVNYYGFGRTLHDRDANTFTFPRIPSWLIFDGRLRRTHAIGPLSPDGPDPRWLARGKTIEALSKRARLDPQALGETIERFNAHAELGSDPDFGRGSFIWDQVREPQSLRPLSEPPFYALEVLPGCSGTNGGLRTDEYGRVLRMSDASVIPGLYAAGNAAAYMLGSGFPGPGATLGPAIVFGWRAGEAAAEA